ncbi:hypothetical protein M1N79_05135, partial [Dehalococcoidia bacterium]|nr:hypothetical protein [Dehalococcoidia bacterium]
ALEGAKPLRRFIEYSGDSVAIDRDRVGIHHKNPNLSQSVSTNPRGQPIRGFRGILPLMILGLTIK